MPDTTLVGRPEKVNWNFIAHILRDVFEKPIRPAVISNDGEAMRAFRSATHSLGFYQYYCGELSTDRLEDLDGYYLDWDPRYFSPQHNFHDFVLVHNSPMHSEYLAQYLPQMCDPGSFIVVSDSPGVSRMPIPINMKKTRDLECYPVVFKPGKVKVYENI